MQQRAEDFAQANDLRNMSPFEILLRSLLLEHRNLNNCYAIVAVKLYRMSFTPAGVNDEVHLEFNHGGITIGIDPGPVNDVAATYEITTINGKVYRFSEQSSPCRVIVPAGTNAIEVLANIHHHISSVFLNQETSELVVDCWNVAPYNEIFSGEFKLIFDVLKVRKAAPPEEWAVMKQVIIVRKVMEFAEPISLPDLTNPLDLIVIRDGRNLRSLEFRELKARQVHIYNVSGRKAAQFVKAWIRCEGKCDIICKMEMTICENYNGFALQEKFKHEPNPHQTYLLEYDANNHTSYYEDFHSDDHIKQAHTGRRATVYQRVSTKDPKFKKISLYAWDGQDQMQLDRPSLQRTVRPLFDQKTKEMEATKRILEAKQRELNELNIEIGDLKLSLNSCDVQIQMCHTLLNTS